jgi:hypothetical protein
MNITNLPSNKNFLSPLGFRFSVKKTPGVNYFVQSASIPSISLGSADIQTPFVKLPFAGEKVTYGDFTITFRVDEELKNYLELHKWMIGLGKPKNFDQSKEIYGNKISGEGAYSDATLIILNSAKNPIAEVIFYNIFPSTLSELVFDSRQTQVNYIDCAATFAYESFTLNSYL